MPYRCNSVDYTAEYAASGRTCCREFRCKNKPIAQGELRIGVTFEGRVRAEPFGTTPIVCARSSRTAITAGLPSLGWRKSTAPRRSNPGTAPCCRVWSRVPREGVVTKEEEEEPDEEDNRRVLGPKAEYARSNRSNCRGNCAEPKIDKGGLMIGSTFRENGERFERTEWYHPECLRKSNPTVSISKLEDIQGASCLDPQDQDTLRNLTASASKQGSKKKNRTPKRKQDGFDEQPKTKQAQKGSKKNGIPKRKQDGFDEQPKTKQAKEAGNRRVYLDCPFSEKNRAKARGAKFDWDEMSWYVPAGVNKSKFSEWLPWEP